MNKEIIMQRFKKTLEKAWNEERIRIDEPMNKYTTFKIGGPADILIKPTTKEELVSIVEICNEEGAPYYIIGNGSNLLVSDDGYRGVIIQLYKEFQEITLEENVIYAQSGALLSKIATTASKNNLAGMEFAHGIPGTLGGAVTMNAGAYGGEMKDIIVSCDVMTREGEIFTLSKDELELGYRTSIIAKKDYIVIGASLKLQSGNIQDILDNMKDYAGRRKDKQPLDKPSAGSTFKRPEGHFAGKLIMDSDLRGFQVGGARVSDKHCGFVVNEGNATAKDVINLIEEVTKVVDKKYGIVLEPEVKMLGLED